MRIQPFTPSQRHQPPAPARAAAPVLDTFRGSRSAPNVLSRIAGAAVGSYAGYFVGEWIGLTAASLSNANGVPIDPAMARTFGQIVGGMSGLASGWDEGILSTGLTVAGGYYGSQVGVSMLGGIPGVVIGATAGAWLGNMVANFAQQ